MRKKHNGSPSDMPQAGGPPGGMPPTGGPPGDVPIMSGPPENIPEEARAIIPDFKKWRNIFFRMDYMFVLMALFLGLIYFLLTYQSRADDITFFRYMLDMLILPTIINIFILILAFGAKKHMPDSSFNMALNFVPIIAMVLLCAVITISRCELVIALAVYCLPIYMSTLYNNRKACLHISHMCLIFSIVATVRHVMISDGTDAKHMAAFQGFVLVFILSLVMQVSVVLIGMTVEQRNKMYAFVRMTKEAQTRAEASSRAKSTFLANMSHEIRTPINAILGMDEMILRETRDEQITDYAENIYSASTSLLSLVNDVLDISKIESGKIEIAENIYDTSSLIHDCCNMINERVNKKHLAFNVYCNPNLPSQLRGDDIHLRQVITNLLSNAAKYTERGSVTLSVDREMRQDTFYFIVTVKDTGIGIKEEDLGKMFSQFTRLDLDKNRTVEGTGLGLALSKQLIDLMNGELTVESVYGEGSTFTLSVPQQVVDASPVGNLQEHYHDMNIKAQKSSKRRNSFVAPEARILAVDDVEVNLKVVSNLLKQTKITVDTAQSGKICLEKVAENAYDIILMDHMMPEMSGIDTYRKMKETDLPLNNNTPVIMLTANAISGVREEYLQVGFADYLSKPILGDKLEHMILKYLPEEKVQYTDDAPEAENIQESTAPQAPSVKNSLSLLQEFYQAYPKIDIVHGMGHYGQNTDIYISVLHSFCNRIKPEPLDAFFEQRDAEKYEIVVHDMKRVSADTGFFTLSETAAMLERAAQTSDWDTIANHHASFVAECQSVISTIKNTLDRRKIR